MADIKYKEAFPYPFRPSGVVLPSNTAHRVCSECQDSYITNNVIQLHSEWMRMYSVNSELDEYVGQLPDWSGYPIDFNEGFFGHRHYFELQKNLDLAFAEENTILNENEQKKLENLLNNFIKEKGRRYPDDNELVQWLNDPYISHCKIFDLRGLNYIWAQCMLIRFVVIIHLTEEVGLWHSQRLWREFLFSEKERSFP